MSDNQKKVKVVGYAQRVFYNNGIEYRNFTNNLVGEQSVSDGGLSNFTANTFVVKPSLDTRSSKFYISSKFSDFYTLENITPIFNIHNILTKHGNLVLRIDDDNFRNFAYFGSLKEYIRVNIEEILHDWPASLYVSSDNFTPKILTITNKVYNVNNNTSEIIIDKKVIDNKYNINYTNLPTTDLSTNKLRNFTDNFYNYSIILGGTSHSITKYVGTNPTDTHITLTVEGNIISGNTTTESYHIRPNNYNWLEFYNNLNIFQRKLLNPATTPKYTSKFIIETNDSGQNIITSKFFTWPTLDNYNLDYNTAGYYDFINKFIVVSENYDNYLSDIIYRELVAKSITDFDTIRNVDGSIIESESGKIQKIIRIYGRELDEIKQYMNGLSFARTVTYNKKDNTPDFILKSIAKTMGWDLTSGIFNGEELLNKSNLNDNDIQKIELEFWRRLILNTPWLWKSKGTRKSIEFLFNFIGAPRGMVNINEYIYKVTSRLDKDMIDQVYKKINQVDTNDYVPDLFIDNDGYPQVLKNNDSAYFQDNGLWYRDTGGSNSIHNINSGNNPHMGPYDGGSKYLNRFRNLIPNFEPVIVTASTIYSEEIQMFTNYKSGSFTGLEGSGIPLYIDTYDNGDRIIDDSIVSKQIINDPKPQEDTSCDCISKKYDDALSIQYGCYTEPLTYGCSYSAMTLQDNGIVQFGLLNGLYTVDLDDLPNYQCCTDLGFITGSTSGITVCQHVSNPIIADYVYINTTCNESNGSILVNSVSGGTGLYTITISGGTGVYQSCNNCTNIFIPNIKSDLYTLHITDGNLVYNQIINVTNSGETVTATLVSSETNCGITNLQLTNIAGGDPCGSRSIYLDNVLLTDTNTTPNFIIGGVDNNPHEIIILGSCVDYTCNPLKIPFVGSATSDGIIISDFMCIIVNDGFNDNYYESFKVSAVNNDLFVPVESDFTWSLRYNSTEINLGTVINSGNPIIVNSVTTTTQPPNKIIVRTTPNNCIGELTVAPGCQSAGTAITYSTILTEASCGLNNGVIGVTQMAGKNAGALGGGDYLIYIKNSTSSNFTLLGTTSSNSFIIQNLNNDVYSIRVSDGTVYRDTTNLVIGETITAVSATVTQSHHSCGKANLTFNMTGGAPCTEYNITMVGGSTYTSQSTPFIINGVENGVYTFELEADCQGNECNKITLPVTVSEPRDIITTNGLSVTPMAGGINFNVNIICTTPISTPLGFTINTYESNGTLLETEHFTNPNGSIFYGKLMSTSDTNGYFTIIADSTGCELTELWSV